MRERRTHFAGLPQLKVDPKDRACWKCGEKGRLAYQCKSGEGKCRGEGAAKTFEEGAKEDAIPRYAFSLHEGKEVALPKKAAKAQHNRTPSVPTKGD